MAEPQISWYVVEPDDQLAPYEEYYAGSFRPSQTMEVNLQVWNNRWGTENVSDANTCRFVAYFDSIEDSVLLDLCKVYLNDVLLNTEIVNKKLQANLNRNLIGLANNGSPALFPSNYAKIKITFGPITNGVKNTLKNLLVDLEYEAVERG